MNTTSEDDILLKEGDAAKYLRISARTLQAWRQRDTGPSYVRLGRSIRYRLTSLATWIRSRTHETDDE